MRLSSALMLLVASMVNQVAFGTLQVMSPISLWQRYPHGIIPAKMGNFFGGNLQLGTNLIGRVLDTWTNQYGCQEFGTIQFDGIALVNATESNNAIFLLLDRGECQFADKIRNAQHFGASLVFVVDYEDSEEIHEEVHIGENAGSLVAHIPLFEISYADGQNLRSMLKNEDQPVFMKAQLDINNEDDNIEVDLWYSSSLDLGLNLAQELSALSYSFSADHGRQPLITPRIATWACPNCAADFKVTNCVSDGKFCAYTPKFFDEYNLGGEDVMFEMTGREILIQGLREKCLHQVLSEKYRDEGELFWTFFNYIDKCFKEDGVKVSSIEECYDWTTVMINGHEELRTIEDMFWSSFEKRGAWESHNRILQADKEWAERHHVSDHPSITINNQTYHGDVNGQDLALAICRAYREKSDECELAWNVKVYQNGILEDFSSVLPTQEDYLQEQGQASRNSGDPSFIPDKWKPSDDFEPSNVGTVIDKRTKKPDSTIQVGTKMSVEQIQNKRRTDRSSWKNMLHKDMYIAVASIVLVNMIVLLFVRRHLKRQSADYLNSNVREAVSQYFALASNPDSVAANQ